MRRIRRKFTHSRTSPKNDRRGCLCPDGKSYSTECCDGSLQAQGIGNITKEGIWLPLVLIHTHAMFIYMMIL
jgi:hypothetical protein